MNNLEGLLKAVREGNVSEVEALIAKGEDVNKPGKYSLTPLHVAALHGKTLLIRILLDRGANPDVLDDWRCTPLHNAAGAGHEDICRELCYAGARMDIRCANKVRESFRLSEKHF